MVQHSVNVIGMLGNLWRTIWNNGAGNTASSQLPSTATSTIATATATVTSTTSSISTTTAACNPSWLNPSLCGSLYYCDLQSGDRLPFVGHRGVCRPLWPCTLLYPTSQLNHITSLRLVTTAVTIILSSISVGNDRCRWHVASQ
jgi:hypothetical protein